MPKAKSNSKKPTAAPRHAVSELPPPEPRETRPWEEIETGRYQPRRIRGSCRGRELG